MDLEKLKVNNLKIKKTCKEEIFMPIWVNLEDNVSTLNVEMNELKEMLEIHNSFMKKREKTDTETGQVLRSLISKKEIYMNYTIEIMKALGKFMDEEF